MTNTPYTLALTAICKIDYDFTTGYHYRTTRGKVLTTLDQVMQAAIDGEFVGQKVDNLRLLEVDFEKSE